MFFVPFQSNIFIKFPNLTIDPYPDKTLFLKILENPLVFPLFSTDNRSQYLNLGTLRLR